MVYLAMPPRPVDKPRGVLRAHLAAQEGVVTQLDLKFWPDVEDPATQHTISGWTLQIRETYPWLYVETSKEQPLLKQARAVSSMRR